MKLLRLFLFSSLLMSQLAHASGNFRKDPIGDVDGRPSLASCPDLQTDMIGTDLTREGDNYVMRMTMFKEINLKQQGYREYYFWLDLTESEQGFQPYMPDSAAWPDMSADYRIFFSSNTNENGYAEKGVKIQNCLESYCADDLGLHYTKDIDVQVEGATVTFTWPVGLLPAMQKQKTIKVGYTTYYEYGYCSGEDDSPNWGKKSHVLKVPPKSSVTPTLPPPPQPD